MQVFKDLIQDVNEELFYLEGKDKVKHVSLINENEIEIN